MISISFAESKRYLAAAMIICLKYFSRTSLPELAGPVVKSFAKFANKVRFNQAISCFIEACRTSTRLKCVVSADCKRAALAVFTVSSQL